MGSDGCSVNNHNSERNLEPSGVDLKSGTKTELLRKYSGSPWNISTNS